MNDKHVRSVAKSISWRIIGTIITSTLVFLFTGLWAISLVVGAMEFVVKLLAFYIHERVWFKIGWGKRDFELLSSKNHEKNKKG
jgi:adenylylsulfate kinase